MSFYYHWTTMRAWVRIKKTGLRLSKPTTRRSPVGVPYNVKGGKIWLCDRAHIQTFAEHLKRIKGKHAAQVLIKVWLWDHTVKRFRPLPGSYFILYPVPPDFLKGSLDDIVQWADSEEG